MKTNILKIGLLGIVAAAGGCVYPDTLWETEMTPRIEYNHIETYAYVGRKTFMTVFLKNTGTVAASNLRVTFSSASPYVSELTSNTLSLAALAVGEVNGVAISFDISSATPVNAIISINIDIADDMGNKWTATAAFSIKDI